MPSYKHTLVLLTAALLMLNGCSLSTDDLIARLDNDKPSVRRSAVRQLVLQGHDNETVGKLISLLDSENDRLVYLTAQVLTTPADSAAIPSLGKLLGHANDDIRKMAIQSLGFIGHRDTGPCLVSALGDSVTNIRQTAVKMIGLSGQASAVEDLIPMMRDKSSKVRAEAIQALYQFRDDGNANITASLFASSMNDKDELVRYVAVQALGWNYRDMDVTVGLLYEALEDKSKHVRTEAIKSLSKIGCIDAVPHFKKMHDFASYQEQTAISDAVKSLTGKDFPDFKAAMNVVTESKFSDHD